MNETKAKLTRTAILMGVHGLADWFWRWPGLKWDRNSAGVTRERSPVDFSRLYPRSPDAPPTNRCEATHAHQATAICIKDYSTNPFVMMNINQYQSLLFSGPWSPL
jgi:hypothetical protein